jgi:hypothetical protein
MGLRLTTGWLRGFLKRYQLSLRVPTRHVIPTARTPPNSIHWTGNSTSAEAQVVQKTRKFHQFLTALHQQHPIQDIINVDQTPVWWNALLANTKTLDHRGRKQITTTMSQPGNPREKISVILACSRSGQKLPPAIVVQSHRQFKQARIQLIHGVLVFWNPGTSMCNGDIMRRWIAIMMGQRVPKNDEHRNILIMDSFRGHLTQDVRDACQQSRAIPAIIPGGLTSHLQPLDLTVNRSFKSKLKQTIGELWKESHGNLRWNQMTQQQQRVHTFTKALQMAWRNVQGGTIRNGFQVLYRNLRGSWRDR